MNLNNISTVPSSFRIDSTLYPIRDFLFFFFQFLCKKANVKKKSTVDFILNAIESTGKMHLFETFETLYKTEIRYKFDSMCVIKGHFFHLDFLFILFFIFLDGKNFFSHNLRLSVNELIGMNEPK